MFSTSVLVLAAMTVGIAAQTPATSTSTSATNTTPPSSSITSSPTSSSTSTGPYTTTISVGLNGYQYTPNNVTANPGDVVEFLFFPSNHSVIRAEFGYPCYPYELVHPGSDLGFYSGQEIIQAIQNLPTFQITINDTQPIFFYCGAPGSCVHYHMIGAINPNATESLEAQLKFADNVQFQLLPGQAFPTESGAPSPTAGGNQTAETGAPTSGGSGGSSSSNLTAGAIAGIAIGSAAVLLLAAALIYMCGRRGGLDKAYRNSTVAYPPPHVVEAKYNTTPKSPGNETWNSQYSTVASHDPYTQNNNPNVLSPQGTFNGRSPPVSPQHMPGYGNFPPGAAAPLMGNIDGTHTAAPHPASSPPLQSQSPPVELPASEDPGNSPLPNYQPSRQFSWAGETEANYRPTKS